MQGGRCGFALAFVCASARMTVLKFFKLRCLGAVLYLVFPTLGYVEQALALGEQSIALLRESCGVQSLWIPPLRYGMTVL